MRPKKVRCALMLKPRRLGCFFHGRRMDYLSSVGRVGRGSSVKCRRPLRCSAEWPFGEDEVPRSRMTLTKLSIEVRGQYSLLSGSQRADCDRRRETLVVDINVDGKATTYVVQDIVVVRGVVRVFDSVDIDHRLVSLDVFRLGERLLSHEGGRLSASNPRVPERGAERRDRGDRLQFNPHVTYASATIRRATPYRPRLA